jgi:hypothetical protein
MRRSGTVVRHPNEDGNSKDKRRHEPDPPQISGRFLAIPRPTFDHHPLFISSERDSCLQEHQSSIPEDRSLWRFRAFSESPDVLSSHNYLHPFDRTVTFLRMFLPNRRLPTPPTILSLIAQHFYILGLNHAEAALRSEWSFPLEYPPNYDYSQLVSLINHSIIRISEVWDSSPTDSPNDLLRDKIFEILGIVRDVQEDRIPLRDELPMDRECNLIKFENKPEPVEATLNQLIYWLTTRDSNRQIDELRSAFCATVSSYCTPAIFHRKLRDRFQMILEKMNKDKENAEHECVLFTSLYIQWLQEGKSDFEPAFVEEVMEFFRGELTPRQQTLCSQAFKRRLMIMPRRRSRKFKIPEVDLGSCETLIWTDEFELLDLPREELVRQLIMWTSKRFYAIRRIELVDCAWEKPMLKYRAPNVTALTQHYNKVSQWVEMMILSKKMLKTRVHVMEKLIQLAQALFEMRDYLDAMAIVSGFDSNSIFRLKQHVERLSKPAKGILSHLKELFSPDNNFKELRKIHEEALTRGEPVIPYIGLLQSDLFKYYEAMSSYINGLINIRKLKGVYQLLLKFEAFMRSQFEFYVVDQIQNKIEELPGYNEDARMAMSFQAENAEGGLLNEASIDIPEEEEDGVEEDKAD